MSEALSAFLGETIARRPRADSATADFLAREAIGSPIDAAALGGPANGVVQAGDSGSVADDYPRDLDEQLTRIIKWFEDAERASTEARRLAERDSDYRHGNQWTAAERDALRKRGQAESMFNYCRRKVELLCGLERKARTDPKAFPRTPKEEDRAEAATAALRYVADANGLQALRSSVYEDILVYGFGGIELGLEPDDKGGADILLTHVGWERIWYDPHSRAHDFGDARHLGLVLWMDRDQLLDLYPGADDIVAESFAPHAGSYDDRPGHISWQDSSRTRCRIVQCHWTEGGEWWSATITRAGFLATPTKSPFKDAKGRPRCPLVLMSAYVDRDNNRYGMVRDLVPIQDMINKFISKAIHLLSVNRVVAEQGAVADVDRARREAAKPDGYIEVMPGMKFEMIPGGDLAVGQFQLLQHAISEMQASGPNASMAGNDPRELSGRAILAQQAGGAAQNEPLADALRQWTRRVMEASWLACREYWQGERWMRITDDMNETKWIGLNRQITLADELGAMDEQQRAMTMQRMMIQPGDPRLGQVVRTENDISDLAVDIEIEEGADVPAQQAEEFTAIMQLIGGIPALATPPIIKALIASSSLKSKPAIIEAMTGMEQQQAQMAQMQQPIQQAHQIAQVRDVEAKAAANEALAVERFHATVGNIAAVHKAAAESYAIEDVGPTDHPQQVPPDPAPNRK